MAHCFGKFNKETPKLDNESRAADKMVVSQEEPMRTNQSFRELTQAGVSQKRIDPVTVISAASATFDFIKGIASTDAFYRACVIGLENLGNRELINPTWYISYGVIRNLPNTLPANKAGIFTFEKTAYSAAGTSGVLTYTIANTNLQVAVLWSVPYSYAYYSNEYNVKIFRNVQANEDLFNRMYSDGTTLTAYNSGSWHSHSRWGINVKVAMTNAGRASLLVEVKFTTIDQSSVIG